MIPVLLNVLHHGFGNHPSLEVQLSTPLAHLDFITPRRFAVDHHVDHPSKDQVRYLFEECYSYIGAILGLVDRASFEDLLKDTYGKQPDLNDPASCLKHAKLLIIMAFGQLYWINQSVDGRIPGFQYFAAALKLMPEIYECVSITHVETLCLIAYFMRIINDKSAAFSYVGLAVRMAIMLGMHRRMTNPPDGSDFALWDRQRERIDNTWLGACNLDCIIAIKAGKHSMIRDEDISDALRSRIPPKNKLCPAAVLGYYSELSRILGDISRYIYPTRPSSMSEVLKPMQDIVESLKCWYERFPDELKLEPWGLENSRRSGSTVPGREGVSTMLHFYQCISMTVRPLLHTLVRKRLRGTAEDRAQDWTEGLSDGSQSAVNMCISAARETVHMMTFTKERRRIGRCSSPSDHAVVFPPPILSYIRRCYCYGRS
jgi:proline utilization trans-activator